MQRQRHFVTDSIAYEFEFLPDPQASGGDATSKPLFTVDEEHPNVFRWKLSNFTGEVVARRVDFGTKTPVSTPNSPAEKKQLDEEGPSKVSPPPPHENGHSPPLEEQPTVIEYVMTETELPSFTLSPVHEEAASSELSPVAAVTTVEDVPVNDTALQVPVLSESQEAQSSLPFFLDPLASVSDPLASVAEVREEDLSSSMPEPPVAENRTIEPNANMEPAPTMSTDYDVKGDYDMYSPMTSMEDDAIVPTRVVVEAGDSEATEVHVEEGQEEDHSEDRPATDDELSVASSGKGRGRKNRLRRKSKLIGTIKTAFMASASRSPSPSPPSRTNSHDELRSASDHVRMSRYASHESLTSMESGDRPRSGVIKRAIKSVGLRGLTKKESGNEGSEDDEKDEKKSMLSKQKWNMLIGINGAKKKIPSKVRARRAERRSSMTTSATDRSAAALEAPTRLHALCAESNVTLDELHQELRASPMAPSTRDSKGRLPLHILGDNDVLISDTLGKSTARSFAWTLMKAYPQGLTTVDFDGYMPFVCLIRDWQAWIYETHKNKKDATPTNRLLDLVTGNKEEAVIVDEPMSAIAFGSTGRSSMRNSKIGMNNRSGATSTTSSSRSFPQVEMWEEVEWCFEMLSMAMDELAGRNGGLHAMSRRHLETFNHKDFAMRNQLATHVVQVVPTIVKTILLLDEEGGDARKRLLKTSLMRRIMLCRESVGTWITSMLRKKGIPSSRAIDYLEEISQLTVEDFAGSFRSITPDDILAFHSAREEVLEALDELEGTVASLVVLDERQTERAAATPVVWHIMSQNLARPFVVSLVLIDFVMHITLMLAFRTDVSVYYNARSSIGDVPTRVVYFICFHYLIRMGCEALSLMSLSLEVLKGYFMNIWTIFDVVAIIMTLAAFSWNDANPKQYRQGFNAFVLGLLWIKVLGFLKVVNKQMATFILALVQILKDLIYFAIVLVVIIFMFADMFRIAVSTKDNGEYCLGLARSGALEPGPLWDFCSTNPVNSYLRVYALLLGDFELDNYKETTGMTVLFLIFTLLGVIILLNVLIAIISDSYEKAKIGSLLLFGRARVSFVAKNQALESFLRPGSNPITELKLSSTPGSWFVVAGRILRWCVLLSLVATAMSAEVYLATQSIQFIKIHRGVFQVIFMLAIVVVLTCALWVLIICIFGTVARTYLPGFLQRCIDYIDRCTGFLVRLVAARIFGLNDKTAKLPTSTSEELEEEEWTGRLTYLERAIERSVEDATDNLKTEIVALEKRLYEHEELQRQKAAEKERARNLWKDAATGASLLSRMSKLKQAESGSSS